MFEIKKGVPQKKTSKYPFLDMEIWDMFEFHRDFRPTVTTYVCRYNKEGLKKFKANLIDKEKKLYWCWRVS